MSFATKMQKVNNKLINKFNERVEGEFYLIRSGGKSFIDGAWVYDLASNIPIVGLSVNFDAKMINGTTIQSGDVMIKLLNDVKPLMSDKVFMDGSEWSIVALPHILYTGATFPISYQMQLRR